MKDLKTLPHKLQVLFNLVKHLIHNVKVYLHFKAHSIEFFFSQIRIHVKFELKFYLSQSFMTRHAMQMFVTENCFHFFKAHRLRAFDRIFLQEADRVKQ